MLRSLSFLSIVIFLIFPVVAQETIYSGDINSSNDYIEVEDDVLAGFYPEFSTENLSLNISESQPREGPLKILNSYRISVEGSSVISLRLVLDDKNLSNWIEQNKFERDEYAIITDLNSIMTVNSSNDLYSSRIIIPKNDAVIHIAGSKKIENGYQWAVNSENTYCGLYWNPPSNHTEVKNCIGKLDDRTTYLSLDRKQIWIIGLILGLLIISLIIYRKKISNEDRDVERRTEEIIREMKSGDVPMNKELLSKLEKANEKAYNDRYEEASELLEEVEAELNLTS